jgi:hypothetical protein
MVAEIILIDAVNLGGNLSGRFAARAMAIARSTRFSGEIRPKNDRYSPLGTRFSLKRSSGRPWWMVAAKLALGIGARWAFEIETNGIWGNVRATTFPAFGQPTHEVRRVQTSPERQMRRDQPGVDRIEKRSAHLSAS